jgi:hypothetical protein
MPSWLRLASELHEVLCGRDVELVAVAEIERYDPRPGWAVLAAAAMSSRTACVAPRTRMASPAQGAITRAG